MKLLCELVDDERFAVELVDLVDGTVSTKSPRLPEKESQGHAFTFVLKWAPGPTVKC